jgi:hypothetical protein
MIAEISKVGRGLSGEGAALGTSPIGVYPLMKHEGSGIYPSRQSG